MCSCTASTITRNWYLKTRVWDKCVVATWNIAGSTGAATIVAADAAGVRIVRFQNWRQHHSSDTWNEHAVVMFKRPLRLFHLIIILWISWDVTFCNCLSSNSEQSTDEENSSEKQGTNLPAIEVNLYSAD
ncbi:hypothetical protein SCA6_007044 [Theobroma cacao]